MHYNPCGHGVDWGRRCYSTTARPFRDSDTEVSLNWYPADTDKGPLPFPSKICSLDWMGEKHLKEGVGEIWNRPRPFKNRRTPLGIEGDHICGTPDEFLNGEVLDPSRPITKYTTSGVPLCCDPQRREAFGGPKLIGHTYVTRSTPYRSDSGPKLKSAVHVLRDNPHRPSSSSTLVSRTRTVREYPYYSFGGPKLKRVFGTDAEEVRTSAGGPKLKGITEYTKSFPCPPLVTTCGLAQLGWVDNACSYPLPPVDDSTISFLSGMRVYEVLPDTDYHMEISFDAGNAVSGTWELRRGTSCSDNFHVAGGSLVGTPGVTFDFNSGPNDRVYLHLSAVRSNTDLDSIGLLIQTV